MGGRLASEGHHQLTGVPTSVQVLTDDVLTNELRNSASISSKLEIPRIFILVRSDHLALTMPPWRSDFSEKTTAATSGASLDSPDDPQGRPPNLPIIRHHVAGHKRFKSNVSRSPSIQCVKPKSLLSTCKRINDKNFGHREKLIKRLKRVVLRHYRKIPSFHHMLNLILRQRLPEGINRWRLIIEALTECLRRPLPLEVDSVSLTLYRGQQMTWLEVHKLKTAVGEVITSSCFLSTTFNPQVAECFVGDGSNNGPYLVSVRFKIELETHQTMKPYAFIINSAEEEEVLFSPYIKFRLKSCRKLDENGHQWMIELQAVSEEQQRQLTSTYGDTFSCSSSDTSTNLINEAMAGPVVVVLY